MLDFGPWDRFVSLLSWCSATTNPSLLNKAARMEEYKTVVDDAVQYAKGVSDVSEEERMHILIDKLAVNFGKEILQYVPGYVSTEVDARLSFDAEGSIRRAHRLIKMYEDVGVSKDRILIKLASTWEGLKAAEVLQKEGIHCNMTLMFNFYQAVVAANVGATLVSPFVGRIYDWYKKAWGREISAEEDPGVLSVRQIYRYFKSIGADTVVMGASFRNVGEIRALAGCDKLTINPDLLRALRESSDPVDRVLDPESARKEYTGGRVELTESEFRFQLNGASRIHEHNEKNAFYLYCMSILVCCSCLSSLQLAEDAMATEKLAEGIRKFSEDIGKLEDFLKPLLNA